MSVLLFTHKNDIDGMGNVVLAKLAFLSKVDYELCGTFDLTETVEKRFQDGTIYDYDYIYVTDLCLEEPVLSKIAEDKNLEGKIEVFDHHKTFAEPKYTDYEFIKVQVSDDKGLCCGTSLFYQYLVDHHMLSPDDKAIKEFVELTRQHDTWEWKNIYNNEKARELATLFDVVGCEEYITLMTEKLRQKELESFEFTTLERTLINNRLKQIEDKLNFYAENIHYQEILGMKAGIIFIDYEYRNELAEYFKENNFDMDFAMMVSMDRGVVSYRSVKDGIHVRPVAEAFGGKGHEKAASNPITNEMQTEILKVLTKTEKN